MHIDVPCNDEDEYYHDKDDCDNGHSMTCFYNNKYYTYLSVQAIHKFITKKVGLQCRWIANSDKKAKTLMIV